LVARPIPGAWSYVASAGVEVGDSDAAVKIPGAMECRSPISGARANSAVERRTADMELKGRQAGMASPTSCPTLCSSKPINCCSAPLSILHSTSYPTTAFAMTSSQRSTYAETICRRSSIFGYSNWYSCSGIESQV
jgi:hypothetical protein